MTKAREALLASIRRSRDTIDSLAQNVEQIETICGVIVGALEGGNKLLTAGHGGSAADALHMAEELVGRFRDDRKPLPAVALVADPTLLTCISNDYGFEQIFPRQVRALGKPGDVLVIFSTSGNGEGFRLAVEEARSAGITSVALLGKGGGPLAGTVDHEIIVMDTETARIQEAHTLILHLVLERIEEAFASTG